MKQHRILEKGQLLDSGGNVREPGWATAPLLDYARDKVATGPLRIKEWDYYLVQSDEAAIAFTVSDHGFIGLHSVAVMDFSEPSAVTRSVKPALPLARTGLSEKPGTGDVSVIKKNFRISYTRKDGKTLIEAYVAEFSDKKPLVAEIELYGFPEDSMMIATPFEKAGRFYYNVKTNCIRVNGYAMVGSKRYEFGDNSAGCYDFGRGVWTYSNTWYWATASAFTDKESFGWNLGYGFGDTSAATENMLFYNGKAHKLEHVDFGIPMKGDDYDFMKQWHFTSSDERFDMIFEPVVLRNDSFDIGVITSIQNQVFGKFTGKMVLDNGRVISVENIMGSCEVFKNRA